jgi:uncharacterized protein (TIGR03663 family)
VATASTKRRRKRQAGAPGRAESRAAGSGLSETAEVSQKFWLVASIAVVAVAALLRLYALELKPMHHDEGVNGFFLTNLVKRWEYAYQPDNYHGPTLYYLVLPFTSLFGLKTWAVRLLPVACGLGTVGLVLCLRRYVGAVGALAAAALLAVSPGAVYYSRYFIHEMMFVFLTLATVVALLKFYEEGPREIPGSGGLGGLGAACAVAAAALALVVALYPTTFAAAGPGQYVGLKAVVVALSCLLFAGSFVMLTMREGDRAIYLLLVAASAALMFATKETHFISAGVLLLAALIGRLWVGRVHTALFGAGRGHAWDDDESDAGGLVERAGGWERLLPLLVACAGVFLFLNVVFYSSFFTNPKGVPDSLKALNVWAKTGASEFHAKPWYTYVKWLIQEETPILALGALGSALALWLGRSRFAVFAGAWAFGTMAAYSLVKYKTPWLVLNFTVPMAIAGGYAVAVLDAWSRRRWGTRLPAQILMAVALALCLYQTVVLNFREYDNDRYPYVYSHTRRDFNVLVGEINATAARAGTATDTRIAVTSPGPGSDSYWPLPWYLNDYKSVGYYGQLTADLPQMPIVVGNLTQDAQLRDRLAATHRKVGGTYSLRPGVDLVLYARREYVGGRQ